MLTSLLFALFIHKSYQQDDGIYDSSDDDDDSDSPYCSFISGEGCMNGVCKFCALCVPSDCILATPYSTGNNDGSTCAATDQDYGYDFYNYCLSSGTDDDDCNTSTECYPYRQGNTTMQHTWTSLTCDQNTCQLIMNDGSPPPKPIPLDNTNLPPNSVPYNITANHHPAASGHINPHSTNNGFRNNSPAIIALTSISVFAFLCLLILLIRVIFFKTKYWHNVNKYVFCGVCSSPPRHRVVSSQPPSFRSQNDNRSIRSMSSTDDETLPSYHRQDPSLPKYEQAIVTQIRGLRLSIGSSSTSSTSSNNEQQPIWVPVYYNAENRQIHVNSPILSSLFYSQEDWAAPRHRTIVSTPEEEEEQRQ